MARCLTPLRESDTKRSAAVGLLAPMGGPVSDTLTGVRHQAFSGGGACSLRWVARCLTPEVSDTPARSLHWRLTPPAYLLLQKVAVPARARARMGMPAGPALFNSTRRLPCKQEHQEQPSRVSPCWRRSWHWPRVVQRPSRPIPGWARAPGRQLAPASAR